MAEEEDRLEVTVSYAGLIQRTVGCREETLHLAQDSTLGELLQGLVARHGAELSERLISNGDLAPHTTILVNGQNAISLGGLKAKLAEGSQAQVEIVMLGPPLMGG